EGAPCRAPPTEPPEPHAPGGQRVALPVEPARRRGHASHRHLPLQLHHVAVRSREQAVGIAIGCDGRDRIDAGTEPRPQPADQDLAHAVSAHPPPPPATAPRDRGAPPTAAPPPNGVPRPPP